MSPPQRLLLVATLLAAMVGVLFTFAFGGESVSVGSGSRGQEVIVRESVSALEQEGPSILLPFAVPILLTGFAFVADRHPVSRVIGIVGLGLCFLAILSVGIFYVPSFALVLLASRHRDVQHGV